MARRSSDRNPHYPLNRKIRTDKHLFIDKTQMRRWKRRNYRILAVSCGLLWIVLAFGAHEIRAPIQEPALTHFVIVMFQSLSVVAVIAFFGWLRVQAAVTGWGLASWFKNRKSDE